MEGVSAVQGLTNDKVDALVDVCSALAASEKGRAIEVLADRYPFDPQPVTQRKYGPVESTRVFVRDGFIDRYSGDRLIFPPVFRLISLQLPEAFPFHPNWKTDETHAAYDALGCTVDHVQPVTQGGADDDSNWVTTSMAHNFAKGNYSLDQLGWTLHPPGDFGKWDGLVHWFIQFAALHPESLDVSNVRQWHRAAESGLTEVS